MYKKEEKTMEMIELSKEELENTFGGSYWEAKVVNGNIILVFHLRDNC